MGRRGGEGREGGEEVGRGRREYLHTSNDTHIGGGDQLVTGSSVGSGLMEGGRNEE